jgi:ATP-dependent Clp protease ATP-binding subunit ClpA
MQGGAYEDMREAVTEVLRQEFRPEFLNRIDEVIIFRALTREQIKDIVTLQVAALQRRLGDRKLDLQLTDAAKEFLAEKGWDTVYGARPLKRAIQKNILDPLALDVLQGKFREGQTVIVERDGSQLEFTGTSQAGAPEVVVAAP